MGRNKIKIESIKNERNRMVTFIKRKKGLFKKAMELAVLCGAKIFVAVYSKEQQLSIVSTSEKPDMFIEQYLKTPVQANESFSIKDYIPLFNSNESKLNEQFSDNKIKEEDDIDSNTEQLEKNINLNKDNNLEKVKQNEKSPITKNTSLFNNDNTNYNKPNQEIEIINNSLYQKTSNEKNSNNINNIFIQPQLYQFSQQNQINSQQAQIPFYKGNTNNKSNTNCNNFSLPYNSFIYPLQVNPCQNQNPSLLPFINFPQYYLPQQINETQNYLNLKRTRDQQGFLNLNNNNDSINNYKD